ncbi:cytochrome c oxidase subunit II [Benzoatithermus flavus]|uniref:Cytochrome c oxidase subunit 2 n=1 Tax=Benzoatithermus flavus TaxID=3108223 RepID=A0ABU8XLL2_9PROT
MRSKVPTTTIAAFVLGLSPVAAWAAPRPWEATLQPPASPVMERIASFHDLLLWIISLIVLFVLVLLVYACWRFSEKRNPVPSRRSHNTVLEIVWTAVPVLILVIIAIPSFKLLYYEDVVPKTELTIKATGHQWYWSYQYPDNGNFGFDAYMIAKEDLKPDQLRLLETDNRIVVPVNTNIRIQTTAADVIHSWAVPQFGIKIDAIPGRLNETWINIERPGTYYGQCSELCGVNHGFMPITIQAVSKEEFDAWVKEAQTKFARVDDKGVDVASVAVATTRPAN